MNGDEKTLPVNDDGKVLTLTALKYFFVKLYMETKVVIFSI